MGTPPLKKKTVNLGVSGAPGPNGGLHVAQLERFGSAAKAGLQIGDEVIGWNGNRLVAATLDQWMKDIDTVGVGGTIQLQVVRTGQIIEVPMKLVEKKTLSLEVKPLEEVLERKISP